MIIWATIEDSILSLTWQLARDIMYKQTDRQSNDNKPHLKQKSFPSWYMINEGFLENISVYNA